MNSNKKKILVVEDDPTISSIYEAKFKAEGFEVSVAVDGAKALELVRKEKPDLVMLDVILPGLDGFSVLEEIKKDKATRHIAVIMLTNLGTEDDKIKGQKMGAADYLVKASLTPSQIGERIQKVLKIK